MRIRPLQRAALPATAAIFFALSLPARGGPIPQTATGFEPEEVVRGRTAVFTVSVSWEGEASELVFSRPVPPSCRGLTVVGSAQRSVVSRDGDALRQVREFLFTLRGEKDGAGWVGPVRLSYRRRGEEEDYTISTEPLEIPVVSRAASGSSSFPRSALLVLALAAAVLIALYIRWMVRRHQKKSNELLADNVKNLESETLRKLEGARKHRLEGDAGEYGERIRTVLVHYLERKSGRDRPPGGGEGPKIPPEEGAELAKILHRLDELRFGGQQDEMGELDAIYRQVSVLMRTIGEL